MFDIIDQIPLQKTRPVLGIEVVTRDKVAAMSQNIDPQHGCHSPSLAEPIPGESAVAWVARVQPALLDTTAIFIERPDLDSVCAAALLSLQDKSALAALDTIGDGRTRERISLVDWLDRGLAGDLPWAPNSDFVDAGTHPDLQGLARFIGSRAICTQDKVLVAMDWLLFGLEGKHGPMLKREGADAASEILDGFENASVSLHTDFGKGHFCPLSESVPSHPSHRRACMVSISTQGKASRGRGACALGYRYAPIVIARCQDFQGPGWTGVKYTVAVHPGSLVTLDWERLLRILNAMEAAAFVHERNPSVLIDRQPTWGGNTGSKRGGIIGSPMDGPSDLGMSAVKTAVLACMVSK